MVTCYFMDLRISAPHRQSWSVRSPVYKTYATGQPIDDDGGQAVAFDFTEVQFAVARKAPDGQPGPLLRVRVPST